MNPAARTFVAPGKVVLIGEYAVLDGAPAIVAAVDRGVQCTVTPSPRFFLDVPQDDDRFVGPALHEAKAPDAHYTFRASLPTATPSKAGLGGSAAATVCAIFAADHIAGRPRPLREVFERALAVHRAVQGSGSGIDVAASVYGGVQRYQREEVQPVPLVQPVVVWSGRSARTGPRVARYQAWPGRADFVARSTELVDRFPADPIAALRAAHRLLAEMTDAAGVDWRTEALESIAALAEQAGGAAKPSGAGGGDCAVALFPDEAARHRFRDGIARAGYVEIEVRVDAGVRELGPQEV